MSSIKEINEMFKQERYDEAFMIASDDWQNNPDNVWEQRKMAWAYVYMMKRDSSKADLTSFLQHLDGLLSLPNLDFDNDQMIFDTMMWRIGSCEMNDDQRTAIFEKISPMHFQPSNGYSFLLKSWLKCKEWSQLEKFLEWWDLSKLMENDYKPFEFTSDKGRTMRMLPLAEQAHIAYAKLLLQNNEIEKIKNFEPQLELLTDKYPKMTYPGYFCGKLLLALDADDDATLKRLIPFVRRKSNDFWAWQLLSEVFDDEPDKQLACLLRATHCKTKEDFLGKVRLRIAQIYVSRGNYQCAKYHANIVENVYKSNGWLLPPTLLAIICQPWYATANANNNVVFDFMQISNEILGIKKEVTIYKKETKNVQTMKGKVTTNKTKTAFFLTDNEHSAFIPPILAKNVNEGDRAIAAIESSFDKKRNEMGLKCTSIKKIS